MSLGTVIGKAYMAGSPALSSERDVATAGVGVVLVGGAGALGSALLERLSGSGQWHHVWVLGDPTQGDLQSAVRNVSACHVSGTADEPVWSAGGDDAKRPTVGVIVFDQARLYNERERAFWMPQPAQLVAVARRLHAQGVRTLAVAVPHQQALLPEALKRGLASLDEQAVQALGFERLLIVRRAQTNALAAAGAATASVPQRLAAWMLSQLRFMVPQRERPVRAIKLASFVEAALAEWVAAGGVGAKVVPPEVLWDAAAVADTAERAREWILGAEAPARQT